jgi:putative membrane protein
MMYYDYGFYPFHIIGGILSIIFWIFLILLLVRFLRGGRWHRSRMWRDWHESSAIEILKERYAKGEITKEQFEQMKKDVE